MPYQAHLCSEIFGFCANHFPLTPCTPDIVTCTASSSLSPSLPPPPGAQAKKEFEAAQAMIKQLISRKLLRANGVVGIFRANSVGDDIEVYSEDGTEMGTLFGLRQQVKIVFFMSCDSHLLSCDSHMLVM